MIPEHHDAAACPGCATGHPCRVVTTGHLRYWANYRDNPTLWGPVLARDALADAGQPPATTDAPAGPQRPVEPVPESVRIETERYARAVALVESCPHRSNVAQGCRCTADCARLARRVTRKECTDCQLATLIDASQ